MNLLREIRERRGYSRRELAELAGVHPNTIQYAENGRHKRPYGVTRRKIAAALELPMEAVFPYNDESSPVRRASEENEPYSVLPLLVDDE